MNKISILFVIMMIVLLMTTIGCPFMPGTQKNYSTTSAEGEGAAKPEGDDYEIDDVKSSASILNAAQFHTIHKKTDIDFMEINVTSDRTYRISLSEIDGFYPQVSLYHQNNDNPFFTISPFIDSWNETIVYESDMNEILYISVNSKYHADLFGAYKIGYSSIEAIMQTPAVCSATDGLFGNKITITWNAATDASSYEVYRSAEGNDFTKIGEAASTSFDDAASDINPMSTSINYEYKVRGRKASGAVSPFSDSDTGYLKDFGRITDLAANVVNGAIRLSWTNIQEPVIYRIYRAENTPENYSLAATVSGSSYDVAGSRPEVVYYFHIIPEKNGIGGFKSNIASASIPFASFRPNAPAASDGLFRKINIKWDAVSGATGYQLFKSDNISDQYTKLGVDLGSSVLSYDDYAVTVGTYYYYRIRALKSPQSSDDSYSDSGIAAE